LEIYFMPQSYFTPEIPSVLVALAFLGTALLIASLVLAAIVAFALGRRRLARRVSSAGLAAAALYMAVLVSVSLASGERVLRKGDRKYFCEVDCHLAYSVEEVGRRTIAGRSALAATIRTWFDERTIAPRRGKALLTPNPRTVFVLDDSGRRYDPDDRTPVNRQSTPLSRPLRPGESYTTTFVFDLPETARRARLFLGDAPGVESLIIGHENSLFHKKIYFAL
jgi:hypothetical protein